MSDRRKKGCPNEHCVQHINKVKHEFEIDYCPKCGTKLIYVCAKCFCEIEDIDSKHRICLRCKTEADEKRAQAIDKGKDIAKKYVFIPIAAVGTAIITNVAKDAQKDVIKKGTKVAKDTVRVLLKK